MSVSVAKMPLCVMAKKTSVMQWQRLELLVVSGLSFLDVYGNTIRFSVTFYCKVCLFFAQVYCQLKYFQPSKMKT